MNGLLKGIDIMLLRTGGLKSELLQRGLSDLAVIHVLGEALYVPCPAFAAPAPKRPHHIAWSICRCCCCLSAELNMVLSELRPHPACRLHSPPKWGKKCLFRRAVPQQNDVQFQGGSHLAQDSRLCSFQECPFAIGPERFNALSTACQPLSTLINGGRQMVP